MNRILKAGIDILIYSNLLISSGAAILTLEVYYLEGLPANWAFVAFVFFSTFLIYSLHRIIGIKRISLENITGRFEVISKYRNYLKVCAIISSAACLYTFLNYFDSKQWVFFIPAGLIALPYVLPIFNNLRLRDFNYIKIFLIAITWGYVCVLLPVLIEGIPISGTIIIGFAEKSFFIFAITLPFDIRDLKIDQDENVKTLAVHLGLERTYYLCYFLSIIAMLCLSEILVGTEDSLLINTIQACIIYLPVIACIRLSKGKTNDYYYSGLLDASILLKSCFLFIIIL